MITRPSPSTDVWRIWAPTGSITAILGTVSYPWPAFIIVTPVSLPSVKTALKFALIGLVPVGSST